MISQALNLNVADLAHSQRLDAVFGLTKRPRAPGRSLSGLFVVALRPVEFSANPIASYPTSVTGERSVEDGDIVEATVVTLVPYESQSEDLEPGLQRAQVAREIFLEGSSKGMRADALPLAMVALDRGTIRWIDNYMVRREAGRDETDVLGLGIGRRALREAHALQYSAHLEEVLSIYDRTSRKRRFSASQHFLTLPPFGEMPAAAIDQRDFTQIFFPPEIQVDLTVVPEDELPALMEEGMQLPPIDLALTPQAQESTSVLVMLPVPRPQLRALVSRLTTRIRALPTSAPGLISRSLPLERLRGITLPRLTLLPIDAGDPSDAAWRQALAQSDQLWYIRKRNVSRRAEVAGVSVRETVNERDSELALSQRLRDVGLIKRVDTLRSRATAASAADIVTLLSSDKLLRSSTMIAGAVHELEALTELERAPLLPVLERFSGEGAGEGMSKLEQALPDLASSKISKVLATSGLVPELDRLANRLSQPELEKLATELLDRAKSGDAAPIREVIEQFEKGSPQ